MAQLPPLIAELHATTRQADDSTRTCMRQALVPLLRDSRATTQNPRETTEMPQCYPGQAFSQPPSRQPERVP